ncbi:PstS family phosphate ABC transporter substrate-binding protein [Salisediminibacterium beveridgei]|uniref:Phosphate-binding protein n=1 Tax=Salisediminibacterium beveridgei TaxID=632773 RepID=A0A1D7QTR5_9BACI|nr:PstS family phosphate ABC transporter substrate-binding protein [Salisediminibacterium beveridgei]AOM82377.1 Phosphate ABC transporter, periplasmic phosphate-binding protein PstS [Salisediminibacterium beveridgei]
MKKYALTVVFGALLMTTACGNNDGDTAGAANDNGNNNGNGNGEDGPEGYLEIRGSDTMVNLGQAFAEEYMDYNVKGDVSVTGGGSGTGVAAMINNEVDIAQSSRPMTEDEMAEAEANGAEPHEFIVGQDGLAVAVHNDNPIDDLTVQQVKDIFTGKMTDWSEVGWDEGGEMSIYSRQSNSGTYVYFNENVMDGEDFASGAKFMPGSSAIREAIEQEENAIGYIGIGYIEGIDALNIANDEESDYVTPFEESNVDEGTYPIARPLYFYVNGSPEGIMLDYLDFVIKSETADDVRYDTGFYQIGSHNQEQNQQAYETLGLDW